MTKFHQKRLKGGARKRTIFCGILSDIFHSNFDRWHDTEVAALCEIAFDCKDIISTDAVKTARRGLKKRRGGLRVWSPKDSVNPRRGSMSLPAGWVPGHAGEAPACPAPAKHCRGLSHLQIR